MTSTGISNISSVSSFFDALKTKPATVNNYNLVSTYKSDSFAPSTTKPIYDPNQPIDPNNPPLDPPYKPNFFDRPEVRIGGMMLGAGAVGGGIGYAVGSAFGRAGLGAAIGGGLGVAAPVAMLAYALYSWGRNH